MTGFWEWLGRVVMLVLAGMITLSIIGAINAIPSGIMLAPPRVQPTEWPQPQPDRPLPPAPPPNAEPLPPEAAPAQPSPTSPAGELVAVPRQPERPAAADWLEAITYTLLALAGLLALGIVFLARALHHWRRSADALELLARRKPD